MLLPWLIMVNIVGLIVIAFLAIFLTHKISGPTYHLKRDLQKLATGDLTITTVFRKGDRLQDLAVGLNKAVANLRKEVIEIKTKMSVFTQSAEKFPELQDKIKDINNTINNLKT
jgi:methyl-accepting chemotaxis protein